MTGLRHRQRHVHATIVAMLREGLTNLDWFENPAPFQSTTVTLLEYEPQQAGETPKFNTVAVTVDHESEDTDEELGGLRRVEYTVFIDVYGQNEPVGVALASDIKDILTDAHLQVCDFTQSPPAETEEYLEFEHTLVEKIPTIATGLDKRSWRAVKTTAVTYFLD